MSDTAVRAQYEAHPYPRRDPRDEARRLVVGSPSHVDEIVHYGFAGADPTKRGKRFRALVAGGGTGDATVMMGRQLTDRGADAEVLHVDPSRASLKIAQARVRARRLHNVRFLRASLFDLSGQAPFDYIDCCGVLHHLEDPAEGLRRLAALLADDGAMGVMVYGEFGRTGVYHAQAALRLLGAQAESDGGLALARRFLDSLPPGNWLARNPWVADHLHGDDAGLYDLLLHARDRAWTVPQIFDLAQSAGLAISAFVEPARYDPASWLDGALAERAAALPWPERCALAELAAGNMKRHVFYAAKAAAARPAAPSLSARSVPVTRGVDAAALAREIVASGALTAEIEGTSFTRRFGPLAAAILSRIDGRRSLADIHAALTVDCPWPEFETAFGDLYGKLNGLNLLLLRNDAAT